MCKSLEKQAQIMCQKNIGKILFHVSYGPDVSRRRAQIVAWSQVFVVHSSGPVVVVVGVRTKDKLAPPP